MKMTVVMIMMEEKRKKNSNYRSEVENGTFKLFFRKM